MEFDGLLWWSFGFGHAFSTIRKILVVLERLLVFMNENVIEERLQQHITFR
jgi:hypothetical protein